jgi:DNA-directed RNA polymerase subunit RPC12/RpoP
MKPVTAKCGKCGGQIQVVEESLFGQDIQCPGCGASVYIPLPEPDSTVPPGGFAIKKPQAIPKAVQKHEHRFETPAFKEPILAGVYRIFAWVTLVVGLLAAIGTLIEGTMSHGAIMAAVIIFVFTVGSFVVLIGVSELITYIGKTAFYAEQNHELLKRKLK